jgi:hypothetical protein
LVEAATPQERPPDFQQPDKPLEDLNLNVSPTDIFANIAEDLDAQRDIAKITDRGTDALRKLAKLDKNLRDQILAGAGKGGPGSDGGLGGGHGPGEGPGTGPGGKIDTRTKRKLRWTMMFNTRSGQDYLEQLQVLGAILAFKTPDGDTKVVKNLLARPVQLEVENLHQLDRIFWIDDKRGSIEQLVRALGLEFVPDQIIAFFPREFERKLLMKELGFRNKTEDQILETRFQILMRGGGGYEIVVVDQRYLY